MARQSLDLISPDPTLEASLAAGLVRVEQELRESVRSSSPFINEAAGYLVKAGGKRFRPLLVLLAAQFGDPTRPEVIRSAAAVELTHLATLYHDDVMDEAPMRRGASSANARWGNSVAILTGDFLFARTSAILADLGPEAVRIQALTFERLCIGQILETVGPEEGADPVKHHLEVLADKTGSLIAASGRYGALMSGADSATIEVLARFGECIGVAFQLADDLVDIMSESAQSGKTPGTDLREGVPTLAALIALGGQQVQDVRLRELLSRPLSDEDEHAEALRLLRSHPALAEARQEACRWADEARAALAPLPSGGAKQTLELLCDYVVSRTG